jgi:hypothetical protein
VTVAGWVKVDEDGYWHLYIASPLIDEHGGLPGYQFVQNVLEKNPGISISLRDVKLIGAATQMAKRMLEVQDHRLGGAMVRYFGPGLGRLSIDESLIYPRLIRAADMRNKTDMTPDEVNWKITDLLRDGSLATVVLQDGAKLENVPIVGIGFDKEAANVEFVVDRNRRTFPINQIVDVK